MNANYVDEHSSWPHPEHFTRTSSHAKTRTTPSVVLSCNSSGRISAKSYQRWRRMTHGQTVEHILAYKNNRKNNHTIPLVQYINRSHADSFYIHLGLSCPRFAIKLLLLLVLCTGRTRHPAPISILSPEPFTASGTPMGVHKRLRQSHQQRMSPCVCEHQHRFAGLLGEKEVQFRNTSTNYLICKPSRGFNFGVPHIYVNICKLQPWLVAQCILKSILAFLVQSYNYWLQHCWKKRAHLSPSLTICEADPTMIPGWNFL